MKNTNYNLIKLLRNQLDDLWRIERHYLKDARGSKCRCAILLKAMQKQMKANIEALKRELASHHKMNRWA